MTLVLSPTLWLQDGAKRWGTVAGLLYYSGRRCSKAVTQRHGEEEIRE